MQQNIVYIQRQVNGQKITIEKLNHGCLMLKMKNEEEIKYLNKEILEREKGTDWAWWLLIITTVITMVVALKGIL